METPQHGKIGYVSEAPISLACPNRGARPTSLSYPQRSAQKLS